MEVKQDCKMTLSRVAALKKTYIELNIPKENWISVLINESVALEMEYPHVYHQWNTIVFLHQVFFRNTGDTKVNLKYKIIPQFQLMSIYIYYYYLVQAVSYAMQSLQEEEVASFMD